MVVINAEPVGVDNAATRRVEPPALRIYGGVHDVQNGYFRLLAKRFPYAVYDRVEDGTARVRAVLDCRRSPNWITNRLR